MKTKVQVPFWFLSIGTIIALILPRVLKDGMFTDGVLYAAVSNNLAKGMGTFWHPYFDESMFPFFHQHPPLTFGIQSIFFKLFGESIYVERLYSFMTVCISAWLINLIWKSIFSNNEKLKSISWLPIILWIIIPVCIWGYANNLIENTMGIFTLLAVLLAYKGLTENRNTIAFLVFSGVFASLAFLCKGFPSLFVIGIPFLYWLCFRSYSIIKMIGYTLAIMATVGLALACVLLIPDAHNYFSAYINDQVIHSIVHISTVSNRLSLIGKLLVQLLPPIILCGILFWLIKSKAVFSIEGLKGDTKTIILFLLIGVSASLPLMISMEQREHYLIPALPYFAIALSLIIGRGIAELTSQIHTESKGAKAFKVLSIAFVVGGLLFSAAQIGATGTDKQKLHDVYFFGKLVPPKTTFKVSPETWTDWGLHNYFVRYFNITLAGDTGNNYQYYLLNKTITDAQPPAYKVLVNKGELFDLYKKP